ncbi:hypothetical protein [Cytobacillus sp. IB215665]|nr:hypothetical protein [Cytobacillus sp. IB215665]MDX8366590.1 hypothetical protein [Cytobacillus sp. IB215665]
MDITTNTDYFSSDTLQIDSNPLTYARQTPLLFFFVHFNTNIP